MVNKSLNGDDSAQTTPKLTVKASSPKTSSGISKRLLTPCRRVGLSRKRNNTTNGLTPPFSTSKTANKSENEIDIDSTPKLKKTIISKLYKEKSQVEKIENIRNLQKTDSEAVELYNDLSFESQPRKQNSTPVKKRQEFSEKNKNCNKIKQKLNLSEENINEDIITDVHSSTTPTKHSNHEENLKGDKLYEIENVGLITNVNKKTKSPIRQCKVIVKKMKSKEIIPETSKRLDDENLSEFQNEDLIPLKRFKSQNNLSKQLLTKNKPKSEENIDVDLDKNIINNIPVKSVEITPTNNEVSLTKSCIRVIKSKILNISESSIRISDSTDDDFDFSKQNTREKRITSKNVSPQPKKVEQLKKKDVKNVIKVGKDGPNIKGQGKKTSMEKSLKRSLSAAKLSQSSTSSCSEDDDDFKFNTKKTILIRKTYNKNKPCLVRAKTTGSITEKDIEEIKHRIKRKKKLIFEAEKLEEKTLNELKTAIEKWRFGCQQALNELLDIMKKNIPNKENMDIEELLQMLNIPIGLVKYNTKELCFE